MPIIIDDHYRHISTNVRSAAFMHVAGGAHPAYVATGWHVCAGRHHGELHRGETAVISKTTLQLTN